MGHYSAQAIEKEAIPSFQFDYQEVLDSEKARHHREAQVTRAMILGNTYRKKVKITFATLSGLKTVVTTVWATTQTHLILKDGIHIPICVVRRIDFAA